MKALIFGASGQMGSYLYEFLYDKGYSVVPLAHRHLDLQFADLTDYRRLWEIHRPDEIYNFASLMYAPDSWTNPLQYMLVNGLAPLKMLESIATFHPQAKFFQAGSAEVFEKASVRQEENTNRLPENPYGLSKMMAMEAVRIYRDKFKLFACTGIFFNAESSRRKPSFFARRAAIEAARLRWELNKSGVIKPQDRAKFGPLEARRDWGWTPEYVEAAHKMLQGDQPIDYVIGTGESRTCREFLLACLEAAGLPSPEEKFDQYVDYPHPGTAYVPGDVMRAVPYKADKFLGWSAKYKMKDVARMLTEAEMGVWV